MTPYIPWKGKTFHQITSLLQKNKNDGGTPEDSTRNLFLPPPNKIYRREIVTTDMHLKNCSSSLSSTIDLLNAPGGSIFTESAPQNAGLVNTIDIHSSTNKYENGDCTDKNVCASENAKRRVRSSGMFNRRKAYLPEKNNDNVYFTNTAQYLVSRNRTFKQNQYTHIRPGESSLIDTMSQYKTNVYSPNGISHCKLTTITLGVNDTFYYLWTTFVDSNIASVKTNPATALDCFKVVIPPGQYDIQSLNRAVQNTLITNYHYYINKQYGTFEFLIKFIYNIVDKKVELQTYSNYTKKDRTYYRVPTVNSVVMGTTVPETNIPLDYRFPVVYFPPNHGFNNVVGFQSGFYPNIESLPNKNKGIESSGMLSNIPHSVFPIYDIVYYKPSNTRFATQGAVSSSDRIHRARYDAITRSGLTFQSVYGREVSSALAYGVPGNIYTKKDKYGYPNKRTPVLCKSSGEMKCDAR